MALVADGWHMSTHAAALAISAFAYNFARRHAHDPRFSFGTGKFGELAAFSSALILALIALLIGYESLVRLFSPVAIRFEEAMVVAAIGLGVNLFSAWLLFDEHHHHDHDDGHRLVVGGHADDEHDHDRHDHDRHDHNHHRHHHDHGHDHPGDAHAHGPHPVPEGSRTLAGHAAHDTNLRAAYMHVLADALTSVLAIVALLAGWLFGWTSLDPLMGVIGALVIARWSVGLLRTAGAALLDMVPDPRLGTALRERLEIGGDRVSDLHVWRLGPGHTAVAASVVAADPQSPGVYKQRLAGIAGLSHVTVEVYPCTAEAGPQRH
jgi:cation diffusion facilitator family transporter